MIKIGCLNFFDFPNEGKYDIIYGGKEYMGESFQEILIKPLLNAGIELELCNCLEEECDILFISNYPRCLGRFVKGNPIVIYWTYESKYKFNTELPYDYSIGFNPDSDTNLHYPWWQHEYWRYIDGRKDKSTLKKDKFCAFIAGNSQFIKPNFSDGVYLREYICKQLTNNYKKVDCYGGNNIENMGGFMVPYQVPEATEIISQYKFYMSFENSPKIENEYYTTEKLINGFAYNCIPLYWGNDNEYLDKYFNPKSYINCNGMSVDEILDVIKEYDNDDEKYNNMLNENPFNDMSINWKEYAEDRYVNFFNKILEENNLIKEYSVKEDIKYNLYVLNHLDDIPINCKEYMYYSNFINRNYEILSYPQTHICHFNNTEYDLSNCDNIFQYDHCFGELAKMYYIYKNVDYRKHNYIGTCHYRRFWIEYELDNLNDILSECEVVLPHIMNNPNNIDNYTKIKWGCGDFDEFIDIACEKFPKFADRIHKELKETKMYVHHLFIMKSMYFSEYINFLYTIASEYANRHNIKNDEDALQRVLENKELYYFDDTLENTPYSASRFIATALEFFSHVYFTHTFIRIYEAEYKFIDNNDSKELYPSLLSESETKIYCCYHNNSQIKEYELDKKPQLILYDSNKNPLNNFISEFALYNHVFRETDLTGVKYLGLCHYRRIFDDLEYITTENIDALTLPWGGWEYDNMELYTNDMNEYYSIKTFVSKPYFNVDFIYDNYIDYVNSKYGENNIYVKWENKKPDDLIIMHWRSVFLLHTEHYKDMADYILGFLDYIDEKYNLNKDYWKYKEFIEENYINKCKLITFPFGTEENPSTKIVNFDNPMSYRILSYVGELMCSIWINTHEIDVCVANGNFKRLLGV